MKKRILIANDASFLGTGYGVYGKELLTKLHNSGKYEIAELGCYADNKTEYNPPWKFYPNGVTAQDERLPQYKSHPANQFGAWRFDRVLLDFRPHIVFDVRDYWMYSYQEISPLRKYFHWVIMPTVDSAPQKTEWLFTFCNADIVVPYTEWAKNVLISSCGNKINLFPKVANAGFNPQDFYPVEDKKAHKINTFGKDYDVIGLVMRNQKRKLFPDILQAYRLYLNYLLDNDQKDKYDNSILYLHTTYPEEMGWDIPALLIEFQLSDKVFFSYKCRNCDNYFPSKFKGSLTKCHKCNNYAASFASTSNHVSNDILNKIYNSFDLFVQCAICEGFGMPQVEAAACGVPIASVDYSAMTEIAENLHGFKIPVARLFREMETNANRAYPDIQSMVSIFVNFFTKMSDEDKKELSIKARQECVNRYTWDQVFSVWDECFSSIDITKKPDWNSKEISKTYHESNNVPNNLDAHDLTKYIVYDVINEPQLFYSAVSQELIRDLTFNLVSRGGAVRTLNITDLTQPMENLLSNKISCEQARVNPSALKKEDYL